MIPFSSLCVFGIDGSTPYPGGMNSLKFSLKVLISQDISTSDLIPYSLNMFLLVQITNPIEDFPSKNIMGLWIFQFLTAKELIHSNTGWLDTSFEVLHL
jgi:hypothetical protein